MRKPIEYATEDRKHVVTIIPIQQHTRGFSGSQLWARCICEWGSVQLFPHTAHSAALGHVSSHEKPEQEPNGTPVYGFNAQGLRVRLR
jgi:hypothetical protein